MPFQYKNLPYEMTALEPYISAKTMTYHHDKHYKKYVATLNELTANDSASNESLEVTMFKNHKVNNAIFQNAAQVWNHEFYWNCLSPDKLKPSNKTLEILEEQFGSVDDFKEAFNKAALALFGSGWVWIVRNISGGIEIKALEKAENPLMNGDIPLLVCDVWEHAYYLDYQNDRGKYVSQFWDNLNWNFFEQNLENSGPHKSHETQRHESELI